MTFVLNSLSISLACISENLRCAPQEKCSGLINDDAIKNLRNLSTTETPRLNTVAVASRDLPAPPQATEVSLRINKNMTSDDGTTFSSGSVIRDRTGVQQLTRSLIMPKRISPYASMYYYILYTVCIYARLYSLYYYILFGRFATTHGRMR